MSVSAKAQQTLFSNEYQPPNRESLANSMDEI